MKKLYRKSTVHPTPSVVSEHLLSFLPAAILTLTVALSPGDREVLAYLISCSSSASFSNTHRKTTTTTQKPASAGGGGSKSGDDHPPCFSCNCFRCYMSYWVKWDSSPNRQLIHEVIDAFEDSVLNKKNKREKNKERRKGNKSTTTTTTALVKGHNSICPVLDDAPKNSDLILTKDDFDFCESNSSADGAAAAAAASSGGDEDENEEEEEELEKGSVRRLVSFLGERIWSVWG